MMGTSLFGIAWAVCALLLEVVLFWFKVRARVRVCARPRLSRQDLLADANRLWAQKFGGWWRARSPVDEWLDDLRNALDFEQWELAALQLDNIKELNLW